MLESVLMLIFPRCRSSEQPGTASKGARAVICPGTDFDCDNPGCRHGGCQGRRPEHAVARTHAASRDVQLALMARRMRVNDEPVNPPPVTPEPAAPIERVAA